MPFPLWDSCNCGQGNKDSDSFASFFKYVMMKSKYSSVEGKVRIANGVYFGKEEKLVPEIKSKFFFP